MGKLIALGYIFDGTTEYSPGDSFETTDDEAGRLIALGVAKAEPEPEAEALADAPLRDSTNTVGGSADDVVADDSVVQPPPTKDLDPDVLALVERVKELHAMHHMKVRTLLENSDDIALLTALAQSDRRKSVVEAAKARLTELQGA